MLNQVRKYIIADIRQRKLFTNVEKKSRVFRYIYYILVMPHTVCHLISYCYISSIVDCILKNHNFQDKLSAVLIIKDEASYIEEWIEFHKEIGFTKFYIFDNGSTDNLQNILKSYIKEGTVKYMFFPGVGMQGRAYTYACRKYRWRTKYMMMLDVDEFVYPVNKNDTLLSVIDSLFRRSNKAGGIGINLKWYGNSGYKKKPSGFVTESYIHRAEDGWNCNNASNIIKTICNPRRTYLFEGPTHPIYCRNYVCINENGERIEGAWTKKASCKKVRINHYWARSEEEYLEKQKRGNVNTGVKGDKTWNLYKKYNRNEKVDKSILIWWEGNEWWDKKHKNEKE